METISLGLESDVYEFCENRFLELDRNDGGYTRSHDNIVFAECARIYNLKVKKIKVIYHKAKNITANVLNDKTKNLPKTDLLDLMVSIVENNKDTPFYNPTAEKSNLPEDYDLIIEKYEQTVESCGCNGWIIPRKFDFNNLDDLSQLISSPYELDEYFNNFFTIKAMRNLMDNIKESNRLSKSNLLLISQCYQNFVKGNFQIVSTALIPVIESVLSEFWPDKNNIRMMRVCTDKISDFSQQQKVSKVLIWKSIYHFINSLYTKSKFSGTEPVSINRHWILHGRTTLLTTRSDCIRLFIAVHTLADLARY